MIEKNLASYSMVGALVLCIGTFVVQAAAETCNHVIFSLRDMVENPSVAVSERLRAIDSIKAFALDTNLPCDHKYHGLARDSVTLLGSALQSVGHHELDRTVTIDRGTDYDNRTGVSTKKTETLQPDPNRDQVLIYGIQRLLDIASIFPGTSGCDRQQMVEDALLEVKIISHGVGSGRTRTHLPRNITEKTIERLSAMASSESGNRNGLAYVVSKVNHAIEYVSRDLSQLK